MSFTECELIAAVPGQEVRTAPAATAQRAFLQQYQPWMEQVLACPAAEALILEASVPLEQLIYPHLLPGVPWQQHANQWQVTPDWPRLLRWSCPPDHTPRLGLSPVRQVEKSAWSLRWLPSWFDTPCALWLAGLPGPLIFACVPYIAHCHGTSDRWVRWLIVRRDQAAAAVAGLTPCLQTNRKKLTVFGGTDFWLPPDSYCWERVLLNAVTARLVRDDFECFLQRREWFAQHDLPFRRGYLFYGPPGNGKTSAIRVMAAHPVITPYTLDLGDEDTDNETLTALFEEAAEHTPALVIFEDLDRLFAHQAPEQDRRKITLQHLLNCLDGLNGQQGIIAVATANDPSDLDPALLRRPGRFDRVVEFGAPDLDLRYRYFADRLQNQVDTETLQTAAQRTHGFSFAQLREVYVLAGQAVFPHGGEIGRVELLAGVQQIRDSWNGLSQFRPRRSVGFEVTAPEAVR